MGVWGRPNSYEKPEQARSLVAMPGSGGGYFTSTSRGVGWAAGLLLCWVLPGCALLEYTPWGQASASQKRVAAQRMPSRLRAEEVGTVLPNRDSPNKHVERLRAYATPHYEAALVDGQAQFEQALGDANPTLAHDFGFRLELAEFRSWQRNMPDDDLSALLEALESDDPAQDVDWVVILASPQRMVATSADQVGVAPMLGRHLALRAMSDADEFDVIERRFSELAEAEKAKLYAARKRHKAATVLLHELGHTLGLPHELDPHAMMSFHYDTQQQAFSPQAVQLGRRVLELRAITPGTELSRNTAQAALNVLHSAPAHTWEDGTARSVEHLLEAISRYGSAQAASPQAVPAPSAPVAVTPAVVPSELSPPDRAVLEQARAEQARGHMREAIALARPLFERYPDSYAVQELRCQLAMKVSLAIYQENAECQPLRRLSGSPF